MADQGAKVFISSRKAETCQEVAEGINAKRPGATIASPRIPTRPDSFASFASSREPYHDGSACSDG